MVGYGLSQTETWPNGMNQGCFELHTSQDIMKIKLASHVVISSGLCTSVCKMEPFKDHPITQTSHRSQGAARIKYRFSVQRVYFCLYKGGMLICAGT